MNNFVQLISTVRCFSHSQIQDFPSMLNFYHISVVQFFKSNWPEVRAGAAMFIGRVGTLYTGK